jgi:carboxypeptidase Q
MRNWLRPVALAAFCLLAVSRAPAQSPEVLATDQKIIEFARENSQLMENLEYLCDVIGPRLTGTARMKQANEWTAAKMKEYGLENVHLEGYTIPAGWERISCEAKVVSPNGMQLIAYAQPWSPGTVGPVTGPVVYFQAGTKEEWKSYTGKLKGAIVLVGAPQNVSQHPSRSKPGDFWSQKAIGGTDECESTEAARMQGMELDTFLAKEGVAAVLQDNFKPQSLVGITGVWPKDGVAPRIPRVNLAHEHYAMLYRLTQRPMPVKLRLNVENRWIKGPVTVFNTVGEIRGSEKPDEMVICGAHLDSWDLAQGTVDNGTGSMVVLETARIIKRMGLRPKRTIRFVLFSGEEQGLHGSHAYVKAHASEMPKVSAVFVHDIGTGKVNGIGLHGNDQVQPLLEKELGVLKDLGVTRYSTFLMGGTDHASFYGDRVPAFWYMQDYADYSLMHHTQTDTFDKAIKSELVQGATVMTISAYNVAMLPDLLPRRVEKKE